MAKVLIIRLSAIGDVAITIPVIYSVATANPQDSFTVLTQTFLMPVFIHRPSNLNVLGINTKATEKGLMGLLKFASALVKYDYDVVVDLHDVLRTRIIDLLFARKRTPVFVIDKNRKARKLLTQKKNKVLQPLRPVVELYADIFRKAGFEFSPTFTSLFQIKPPDLTELISVTGEKRGRWVGVAPFARHQGKVYPLDKMEQVVKWLSEQPDLTIFLFGGSKQEEQITEEWSKRYPHVHSAIGRYSLDSELTLISKLDLFLSMDSANMQFASLVGTRVISIWGATHPYAGFYGYRQNPEDAIQLDLPCRPCSIFGKKRCYRGDWACMQQLPPETIISAMQKGLHDAD